MKIGIIQFPGSNCERETMLAVKRAEMEPVEFLWNEPREKLNALDGYIIVGGFSYEDRSRAGVIAALDPVMQVIKQQSELGKPVLGICNGAQILVETGLVPGLEKNKIGLSLTDNKRIKNGKVLGTGFYNEWVHMRVTDDFQLNAFTRKLSTEIIFKIPVAHAEGRFIIPPALLQEMQIQGMDVFKYCDENGKIIDEFPVNPNGSICNIAAISNKAGNVMAMMPHPERTTNGDAIFQSMRDFIAENGFQPVAPMHYYPRLPEIKKYSKENSAAEWIVSMVITDNHALSVENALNHAGIPVKIKRCFHWEIQCDATDLEKIKKSGVLFNDRKEVLISPDTLKKQKTFLVRAHDDLHGLQKMQMLKDHFDVDKIHSIRHGILWQITATDATDIDRVIDSHILFNPYSHNCYEY